MKAEIENGETKALIEEFVDVLKKELKSELGVPKYVLYYIEGVKEDFLGGKKNG